MFEFYSWTSFTSSGQWNDHHRQTEPQQDRRRRNGVLIPTNNARRHNFHLHSGNATTSDVIHVKTRHQGGCRINITGRDGIPRSIVLHEFPSRYRDFATLVEGLYITHATVSRNIFDVSLTRSVPHPTRNSGNIIRMRIPVSSRGTSGLATGDGELTDVELMALLNNY